MRKLYLAMGLALVAMLVAAGAAFATVTFDPSTGTGFVGKGDVQTAFGWNNATMQTNHTLISFKYVTEQSVEQDCSTIDRGTFTVVGERTKTQSVNAALAYDNRKKSQYVGWNLTGLGTVVSDDTGWIGPNGETFGSACPDGATPQGAVRITSSTEELRAYFGDDYRVIWTPPAPVV
jgi:hypothetical protein